MSKMTVTLRSTVYGADGAGETSEATYRGHYEEVGGQAQLSWQAEGRRSALCFAPADRTRLSLRERGESEVELRFCVGEESRTLYRVPGVGSLDMTVRTTRLENRLGAQGGTLLLAYEAEIGGAEQRLLLKITAKTEKTDADQ